MDVQTLTAWRSLARSLGVACLAGPALFPAVGFGQQSAFSWQTQGPTLPGATAPAPPYAQLQPQWNQYQSPPPQYGYPQGTYPQGVAIPQAPPGSSYSPNKDPWTMPNALGQPPAPAVDRSTRRSDHPSLPSQQFRLTEMPRMPEMPRTANSTATPERSSTPFSGVAQVHAQGPIEQQSPAMATVSRQAAAHVQRGLELAGHRAFLSARAEIVQALRILTQAADIERQTDIHGGALAAGLRALEECDDFVAAGNVLDADLNVVSIADGHRTPVVRMSEEVVSPLMAQQKYLTYAQEQLGASVVGLPAGSQALQALGKLYSAMAQEKTPGVVSGPAKAMVLHQAAILADNRNSAAANELGVMLAKLGRHGEAKDWLQHSANLNPQATTYHNLAVVAGNLGDVQLAQHARGQEQLLAGGKSIAAGAPDVRWVDPNAFTPSQQNAFSAANEPAGGATESTARQPQSPPRGYQPVR